MVYVTTFVNPEISAASITSVKALCFSKRLALGPPLAWIGSSVGRFFEMTSEREATFSFRSRIDWIDSTWELLATGELYGLTARSGADFKWVLDSTGENIIKGKGYWVMEWYSLSTGEITDYIYADFDTMEGDTTC